MEQLYIDKLYGREIRTFMGKYVDPFNPDPDKISIIDIAHSLSQLCRFNGHTNKFYSVAEHCILVASRMTTREDQLAALMHDASEAYMADLVRPLKRYLDKYLEIEYNMMMAISRKFGFQYPLPATVKEADEWALQWEWNNLVINDRMQPRPPVWAKQEFLSLYDQLMDVPKIEEI